MGTSKKRGGAKAHRKRVAARNQMVKAEQSAMQKLMNESNPPNEFRKNKSVVSYLLHSSIRFTR